ncbi:MAG: YgiT-type zinc finger protein [Oscillospiraceae bacterium]|nr:YgiT-type zinc finger protein [Oscillospiraceae bacterium]
MKDDFTTHFEQLENCIIIIKNVPCFKCTQCGEVAYSGVVVQRLEQIITDFEESLTEIAVVSYSAA